MLQNPTAFGSTEDSHQHSLEILSQLERYQDFMRSIDTMCDMGCGSGLDLEWWATRYVLDDDDRKIPLNISCTGIDIVKSLPIAKQYKNIQYERKNFEDEYMSKKSYDVMWCHDSFQYVLNPLQTLARWHKMINPGGMLAMSIPHNTNVVYHRQEYDQRDFQYFNYTLVSIIHMLAVSGFDCKAGFFKKGFEDPWIHVVVYKSKFEPMDPSTTKWWDLVERNLLPDSAEASLRKHGYVKQRNLVLPWLDRSLTDYGQL